MSAVGPVAAAGAVSLAAAFLPPFLRGSRGALLERAHRLPDVDAVALGDEDVLHDTRGGSPNVDGHLVGLDLRDDLVDGDGIAGRLEDRRDGPLGDAVAHRGNIDLRREVRRGGVEARGIDAEPLE
jgi:hypothetical protein